jgi:large subunit ribosomal protein L25
MSPHTQKIELEAQVRTIMGGKVASLRHSGLVPAVLYGKGQEPISLQISEKDFKKTFHAAGESTLVYINVAGKTYPTIIHDVARHPHSNDVIHADFYKVNLDEKIKTQVPVVFTGEAPAVRDLAGIFIRNVNELEVEALPQNLPHEIAIDISHLENFGDQILLKDINAGKDVIVHGNPEEIIAVVKEPISEEELQKELETTVSVDDVKIVEKEKKAEVVEDETPATPATPIVGKKEDKK